jgi:hypothetical protein
MLKRTWPRQEHEQEANVIHQEMQKQRFPLYANFILASSLSLPRAAM